LKQARPPAAAAEAYPTVNQTPAKMTKCAPSTFD
jgi:hypothetical protein